MPNKRFSIGWFIGLFIIGLVLAFPFGAMTAFFDSPIAMMAANQDDTERRRQFMLDVLSFLGTVMFILPWGGYILHYWTKSRIYYEPSMGYVLSLR